MPKNVGPKVLKMKKRDMASNDHSNIIALCWKYKTGRYTTPTAAKGSLLYESWNVLKPQVVKIKSHTTYADTK